MPHPIDVMVGKRIRLRRIKLASSQTDLAKKLGLTFQQVQKYEKGTNRVSCSRLHEIASQLAVPVGYFFSDSIGVEGAVTEQFDVANLKDGLQLMTAFSQIENNAVRKAIIALIECIAVENRDVK
jgi:transcriptional regulator with XRE-family HTH domain